MVMKLQCAAKENRKVSLLTADEGSVQQRFLPQGDPGRGASSRPHFRSGTQGREF